MPRLTPDMNIGQAAIALTNLHEESAQVCLELLCMAEKMSKVEDIQYFFKVLDRLQVYDRQIWILWRQVCEGSFQILASLLMAAEMNIEGANADNIHLAITGQVALPVDQILEQALDVLDQELNA